MAQRGSGRSGGGNKARPAGRGSTSGRGSNSGKTAGSGSGKAGGNRAAQKQQSAVAAARAIKGARGGGGFIRVGLPILVVVIVAAAVIVGVVLKSNEAKANPALPDGADTSTAILANTAKQATGDTVDGVQSNSAEQLIYHIHAHLAIYINGKQKLLPFGVGIVPPYQMQTTADGPFVAGGSKFYWLHTHDESGVIHIETPAQHTYTLGNFFDLWGQPLSTNQIGPNKGKITAFIGGKAYTGNPRDIPLTAHNVIQLDMGTPIVPWANFTFPQGE